MKKEVTLFLVFSAGWLVAEAIPWTSSPSDSVPSSVATSSLPTQMQSTSHNDDWTNSLYPTVEFAGTKSNSLPPEKRIASLHGRGKL